MMKKQIQTALPLLQQGQMAMLITVIEAKGSTPGRIGAAMVVGKEGLISGTVGGGAIEHECIQQAIERLGTSKNTVQTFVLNNQQAGGLGMVCGGSTQVLFTPLTLDVVNLSQQGTTLYLPLAQGVPKLGEEVNTPQVVDGSWMAVPLVEARRIFIMGGGHVALATAQLLAQLDYPYIVVDDREEFANPERFPHALQTFVTTFDQLEHVLTGAYAPTAQDAMCMLSRGHKGDSQAVHFALTTPMTYIGVMGSRNKAATMFAELERAGFTNAKERVTTPIGLPIGGKTPAELAVSIVGELIQWHNLPR